MFASAAVIDVIHSACFVTGYLREYGISSYVKFWNEYVRTISLGVTTNLKRVYFYGVG